MTTSLPSIPAPLDVPAGRGVLDGVGQQVHDDLLEAHRVGMKPKVG